LIQFVSEDDTAPVIRKRPPQTPSPHSGRLELERDGLPSKLSPMWMRWISFSRHCCDDRPACRYAHLDRGGRGAVIVWSCCGGMATGSACLPNDSKTTSSCGGRPVVEPCRWARHQSSMLLEGFDWRRPVQAVP